MRQVSKDMHIILSNGLNRIATLRSREHAQKPQLRVVPSFCNNGTASGLDSLVDLGPFGFLHGDIIREGAARRYVRGMGDEQPVVIGLPRGHELRPEPGEVLLDAAWRADIPLASSCGGQGVCGDCVVNVVEGAENLVPPDVVEEAWFKRGDRPPRVRLACRLLVRGPAVVSTTYW